MMQFDHQLGIYHVFAVFVLGVWGENEIGSKIRFNTKEKGWSNWNKWSDCTTKDVCFTGSQSRHRDCLRTSSSLLNVCSGVFEESRDCPSKNCKDLNQPLAILSDVTEAPYASFISQECDTDMKYSVKSAYGIQHIPVTIRQRFKLYAHKFEEGYYDRKFLSGNRDKKMKNMKKYCFEPHQLTIGEAMRLSYFNRTSRSTLYSDQNITYPGHKNIAGIAIVVDDRNNLVVIYFAVASSNLGYKKVFYRRWRGTGYEAAV